MIQFQAKYLKMLFSFMAKGDVRYYLNAICIEPHEDGGAILIATDGSAMLLIRDTSAKCAERTVFTISRDSIKFSYKLDAICYVDQKGGRLKISDKIGELYLQPNSCIVDGSKYPNWKKVVPNFSELKDVVSGCVSIHLIDRLKVATDSARRFSPIRFWTIGVEAAPIVVQFSAVPEAFALLMPCRDDSLTQQGLLNLGRKFFSRKELKPCLP